LEIKKIWIPTQNHSARTCAKFKTSPPKRVCLAFEGLIGYENTVIPDVERAILSGHNMNLLGLRGQAKTRLARQLTSLLDEWIPVVEQDLKSMMILWTPSAEKPKN